MLAMWLGGQEMLVCTFAALPISLSACFPQLCKLESCLPACIVLALTVCRNLLLYIFALCPWSRKIELRKKRKTN